MDAVTYLEKTVVDFITDYLVPLRINVNDQSFYQKFHTYWTPTLAILGHDGHEVQRTVGFFQPDPLVASLHLGIAKARLNGAEFETAEVHFSRLLEHYPDDDVVPEALFYRGVNKYKMLDDAAQLKAAYEKLSSDYPDSPWAKRAEPYHLI